MSQLGLIYDEFKADGFQPRMEATAIGANDDLSIFMHSYEVPECLWFVQWQKRNMNRKEGWVSYWSPAPYFGQWILVPR